MSQAMVDSKNREDLIRRINTIKKDVAVQTGDMNEIFISISNTKSIHVYYSKSYKDYIVSFNLGSNKKFILNKNKWKIFYSYSEKINQILG
jgi:hypothetical protein